ncbi:MAG: TonB-dependent receptor [Campylobacterales bacterium]
MPVTTQSIDAQALRENALDGVSDALHTLPGVTFDRVGGRNEASVFVRGFEMRRVPIYLDGVPIYVPYDGYVDLGRYTTYDLERIELTKGYIPMLYGPNAMGGAINLVTRRPSKPYEGSIGGGIASGGEKNYYANLGGMDERSGLYAQAGYSLLEADDYPLSDDFKTTTQQPTKNRINAYRKDEKVSLRTGWANDNTEIAVGFVDQQGEKGNQRHTNPDEFLPGMGSRPFNGTTRYWYWPYWDMKSQYILAQHQFVDGYIKGRLYKDKFDNSLNIYNIDNDFNPTTINEKSNYDDETTGVNIEGGYRIAWHFLQAAVQTKNDEHNAYVEGVLQDLFQDRLTTIALEDTFKAGTATIRLGIAYQDLSVQKALSEGDTYNAEDMDAINYQAGVFYPVFETGQLFGSIAKKSRFAALKERYSEAFGTRLPNPDLKSEYALNYEVGYGHKFTAGKVRASLFYSDIQDEIVSVEDPLNEGDNDTTQLQNIAETSHRGFEVEGTFRPHESLELFGNYLNLTRTNEVDNSIKLTDTPKHKLRVGANYSPIGAVSFGADLSYEDGRYIFSDGTEMGPLTLINLNARYRPIEELTLRAGITNLTDKNYEYAEGYPEPGRMWRLSADYHF